MDKLFLEQLPKAASVLYLAFHEFLKSFSCYFLLLFRRMLYNFVFFYGDLDVHIAEKKNMFILYVIRNIEKTMENKLWHVIMLLRFPNLVSLYKYIQVSVLLKTF